MFQPGSSPNRVVPPKKRSHGGAGGGSISSTTEPLGGPSTMLVGALEGFYNKPWSHRQRMDLFGKMRGYGMNSYLYAPKDDHKHRANWKEKYNPGEQAELTALIQECK